MSDVTFWHDFETDQWTVRDGERTETISPLLREAFTDYHQREMQDMRTENDDLVDEAAAIREQNDRLCKENAKLRELVRDYFIFYSQPGCTYCFCHDECRESEEPCMAFERLVDRTNELGIEVDG